MSTYQGGNNISCHGASDGGIHIIVVGGTAPYYFHWSNGSYNQNLNNITAGSYTVTVTDNVSATATASVTLIQPNPLSVQLIPSEFDCGYNISENGGNNGQLDAEISGGTNDYTYLWSDNSTENKIGGLTAGTYSVTITDMNNCTSTASKTLTEATELQVVSISSPLYHGYNVSCYDGHNGAINLSVTGGCQGSGGYRYNWSNGSQLQNPTGLSAGHYSVLITDANKGAITTQIDLTQPSLFRINNITPLVYPNGYNLSCHICANGSLTVNTTGGVSPITYQWELGQTTQIISGLSPNIYYVTATDGNGCTSAASRQITAPDQEDWTMLGNANTDSTAQFFGTTDYKPVVIKTNNIERMRIHKNGNIKFNYPVKMDDLSITHPLKIDTLKIKRIMAPEGDSIINFGVSSLHFNQNTNNIYADQTCFPVPLGSPICLPWHGMSFGLGSLGWGVKSIAIGNNSHSFGVQSLAIGNSVMASATNAITIGSGPSGGLLNNPNQNSLAIGFNSDLPTVYVTPAAGIGTTGIVGIGIDPASQTLPVGTNATNYKLLVGGAIGVREAWVFTGTTWPDYVFENDYKLKSLDELKKYFRVHKHMPHMPSAKEIKAKGAINIGEIQTNTVLEVEEIYLQLFKLQDRIVELEKQNALLVKLVSDLK